MAKPPWYYDPVPQDEINSIDETVDFLENDLQLKESGTFLLSEDRFAIFEHYKYVNTLYTYPCSPKNSHPTYLALIKVTVREIFKAGYRDYDYFQLWGIARLKETFQPLVIRPEKIIDKFHEMIEPEELDFIEDPEFSKRFYVLSSDKDQASRLLTMPYRDAIKKLSLKDFFLEFNGNCLIIGTRSRINQADAKEYYQFLQRIREIQTK